MRYTNKIFNHSWGYDMTINDFVLVLKETPNTVIVQRIGNKVLSGDGYTGSEVPDPMQRIGKPFRLTKDLKSFERFGDYILRGADKSEGNDKNVVSWWLWNAKPVYYNTMD